MEQNRASATRPQSTAANVSKQTMWAAAKWFYLGLLIVGTVCAPASIFGQTANLGSAPVFGQAVGGSETAATPEGTLLNAMGWVGNVICPIGSAGFLVSTIVQARNGGKWMGSAITTGSLLMVSGGMRLLESMVNSGSTVAGQ